MKGVRYELEEDRFRLYPAHTVVGILETPAALGDTLNAFQDKGIGSDEIDLLCGKRGADILDSEGKNHGFIARVVRIVQGLGEEREQLERYDEHLRRGQFVVSLQVSETHSKEDLAQTLRQHGGEHILYLGRLTIEEL